MNITGSLPKMISQDKEKRLEYEAREKAIRIIISLCQIIESSSRKDRILFLSFFVQFYQK